MIITTIVNHRLYIQFSTWVTNGKITVSDRNNFKEEIAVTNSDFEIIKLPDDIKNLRIVAESDERTIIKNLKL